MFNTLRKRFATWWALESTVRRLGGLDDHLLTDIGFERGNIRTCVKEELGVRKAH
jgi:uncharacterized protein YjiS (DUF1127 family)